jgi:hypothetical protein
VVPAMPAEAASMAIFKEQASNFLVMGCGPAFESSGKTPEV